MADDDDDWVGEPPEGRVSRDRAKPDYWRAQSRMWIAGAGLLLLAIIVVLVVVLS